MSYTTINELPERLLPDLIGTEYLLLTDPTTSYKVSLDNINQMLIDLSAGTYQELTNKVIDDVSNFVHANAIHYIATAVGDIAIGAPVKLVPNNADSIVYVEAATLDTDVIVGVCEDGLLDGEQGEIMVSGILAGVDTMAYAEADTLYYQGGAITNSPDTKLHSQIIGFVISRDPLGKILITSKGENVIARNVSYDNSDGNLDSTNVQDALDEVGARRITATYKMDIVNNEATLPTRAVGEVINGIANVYMDPNLEVITEYTCSVSGDGLRIVFEAADNLSGKTCSVTYYSAV